MTYFKGRMTNLNFWVRHSSFLFVLLVFSAHASAQTSFENFAETIERGSAEQKRDALFQIRNLKSAEASRVAVPALRDAAEIVRATAAFSVIFLPKTEAFAVLSPLLQDKSALVRRETAYALGKVGDANAVNLLLQTFQKDKIAEVKTAAIVALGAIGDASAITELTKILQRKPSEKEEFWRRSAARSIGQIAQIIQTDKTRVTTPKNFLPDRYKQPDAPKYADLSEQFPAFRPATAILIQVLQNRKESGDVRREAAFALGAIGDETAFAILQSNLNAEDYYLAEICREALLKFKIVETVQ